MCTGAESMHGSMHLNVHGSVPGSLKYARKHAQKLGVCKGACMGAYKKLTQREHGDGSMRGSTHQSMCAQQHVCLAVCGERAQETQAARKATN